MVTPGLAVVEANMAPGFADGMRADQEGILWASVGWAEAANDGVQCLAPDGDLIGCMY